MIQKRRILVVIFSLIISIMPQGIYWYYPEEVGYVIGIPYYLFGVSKKLNVEAHQDTYTFETGDLVANQMLHMKLLTYLYVFFVLLLLVGLIYQWIRKKEPKMFMKCTVIMAFGVSVVKLICSFLYMKKYFPDMDSWTWMQGICFIQLAIAGAFLADAQGYKPEIPSYGGLIWKNLGYIWLLGMSTYGNCFRCLGTEIVEEEGKSWFGCSAIFTAAKQWYSGLAMPLVYIVFTIGVILVAIILFQLRENVTRKLLARLEPVLESVTTVYIGWIIGVCLFFPQMKEPTWYFMPGICYSILLSWECWRLTGVGEKQIG